MLEELNKRLLTFHRNAQGGVLVFVALIMLPLLMIVGLAVDTSYGLSQKNELLSAVTAAANAGAVNGKGNVTTINSEAQKVFVANTATMTGLSSPSISYNSSSDVVTVSASVTVSNVFMVFGGVPTSTYEVSATASRRNKGYGCIYSLNTSANGSITISGGSTMNVTGCGVYGNSSSSSGLKMTGNSALNTYFVSLVGNYSLAGGSTITATNGITTGASAIPNPIASAIVPTYSSCNFTGYSTSTTSTINPGVYCNGISVANGGKLTLNPGVYILDGGNFSVANGGSVSGTNVTVILTKKLKSSYTTLDFKGGAVVTLTAPSGNPSDPLNGIAIYKDKNAPGGTDSVGSGVNLDVSGILGFPSRTLSFSGNITSTGSCTILIADKLSFGGGASTNCTTNLLSIYMAGK